MRHYIHELSDWPRFTWRPVVSEALVRAARRQGVLIGRVGAFGFDLPVPESEQAMVAVATDNAVKTSAIEGEVLDPQQVRSSVGRQLGIDVGVSAPISRSVDGLVAMLLDAVQNCAAPLTAERLWGWHAAMFPTGYSGFEKIIVGGWRQGPMQVVSGPEGKQRIHLQAPDAGRVDAEMKTFLDWFNDHSAAEEDLLLKSGIAHLWFVTIHPFADGNGRIGRALADLLLSRSDRLSGRFYSLSSQVEKERKNYALALEEAQTGTLDITSWLTWYLGCLERAIDSSEVVLERVMQKAHLWRRLAPVPINERQRRMIEKLFESFVGKLTAKKWAEMTKTSLPTATRDINELVSYGVLAKIGDGRSTHYALRKEPESGHTLLTGRDPEKADA